MFSSFRFVLKGALSLAFAVVVASNLSAADLVHRYSFTADASDSVGGSSWNGTLPRGGTFANGKLTLAASSSQYVQLPAGILSNYTAVTIEAWVTTGTLPTYCFFYGFGNTDSSGAGDYYIFGSLARQYSAIAGGDPGYSYEQGTAGGANLSSVTVHWTAVYNPPAGYVALYTNGVLQSINTAVTTPLSAVQDVYSYIGKSLYTSDPYGDINLDEFRIWNGALNPLQVTVDFAAGPDNVVSDPGAPQSLYWPLNGIMSRGSAQSAALFASFASVTNVNVTGFAGVTYSSSDTNVVIVGTNGLVTAIGAGLATVTASYEGINVAQSIQVSDQLQTLAHQYSFTADASDSVGGTAWNGTLPNGGTFANGQLILASGSRQYVQLPAGILSNYTAVTIEAWATFPDQLPGNCFFYGFGNTDASGAGENYIFCAPQGGRIAITGVDPGYNGEQNAYGYFDFSYHTNFHVVAVYNPPAGCLALYTNGVLAAMNSAVTIPMSSVSNVLSYIGRSLYTADPYPDLSLDEFRIYSVALSAREVAQDYQLGPNVSPQTVPVKITVQPSNVTVTEQQPATFNVVYIGHRPVAFQWFRNGTPIAGATNSIYQLASPLPADSGSVFYVTLTNSVTNTIFSALSSNAVLTVLPDTNPPVVGQVFNAGTTNVQIVYSKIVEAASATNIANYVFTNGLPVTGALLNPDNMTVVLTTAPIVYSSNYWIVINGVRDRATTPNTIATNTTVTFQALPYAPQDIGNPLVASSVIISSNRVTVTAAGTDFGGTSDQGNFQYAMRTGDFDVAVRLASLALSDVWAKAGLMARETMDPGARFAAALAAAGMNGDVFEWRDPAYSQASSAGNFAANYPNTWLRLKRAGNLFSGYGSYDGQTWSLLGSATIVMPGQIPVGLAVSSRQTSQPTTAQFYDFNDVSSNAVVAAVISPHEQLGPSSRRTPIVISEIMYKPAPRSDGNNTEFLEIYNSNPFFQDISGYQIVANNMNYTFPAGTLIPGQAFFVVAASPSGIQNVYGLATNVFGPYTGSLKKSGTIQLLDEQGSLLLEVPYSNVYPWPVATDGTGHSIVLANPSYGEGDPRAWDISDVIGGSPGEMEAFRPSPLRSVVINEILAHSENAGVPQFIELYNHSSNSVDVSGCILTDDPTTNKFVIPSGTVIGPAGFVSFTQSQFGFTLNGAGETLYFIKPDNSRILDAVQFGAQANGVSCGRWPDGANDFYAFTTNTPGTNNSTIVTGDIVINELMYDPISGNDDDQYIELYNKGTNMINLSGWQFTSGVTFTIPTNTTLPPDGYLVVARNQTNLFAHYPNLNAGNTVGNYTGSLAHHGERVALAMPQTLNGTGTIYVVENEVTYGTGGRWGQWSHGGGSSLELSDPRADNRLAANWADSDETHKSSWVNIETTGVLDYGMNYGANIGYAQFGPLDAGECLADNVEVDFNGTNLVSNSDFESGLANWSMQGCMVRSSLENEGYASAHSLHVRCSDRIWTGANACQVALNPNSMTAGQTATLRFKARWLRGWPEAMLRLNGNWLEAAGALPVPANLGTPGLRNSAYATNAGPAIYEVTHSPSLPAANQPVVVTTRSHDPDGVQTLTLNYRVDPATTYTSVLMKDDGTGGDAIAGDGLYSATIPGQAAGVVVAFTVTATDTLGAGSRFPALLNNSGPERECAVMFGDSNPASSFGAYHLWLTQTNINRWVALPVLSNETIDGTLVCGNRVIYNMSGRYAGSPYHEGFNSPLGNPCHYNWDMPNDDLFLGSSSFNKIHWVGNDIQDDTPSLNVNDGTLQREQAANTFLRGLGIPWVNRRYVAVYVNGHRRGELMEDALRPSVSVPDEYFPNDTGGLLYKFQPWFEFAPLPSGNDLPFINASWGFFMPEKTTGGAYKTAIYRWWYEMRSTPDSLSDYTNLYALIDAGSSYTNPNYVSLMENQANMENWMRLVAANHAAGNWDCWGVQNGQNIYGYVSPNVPWTLFMFDFSIVLGNRIGWSPGQNLFTTMPAFDGFPADSNWAAIMVNPTFLRMYVRALKELVNGPMQPASISTFLEARYAAFAADGLSSVQYPSAVESWVAQARTSIASQIAALDTSNFTLTATNVTASGNQAVLSGTAPVQVATITVNGVSWPLTWTSTTSWVLTLPVGAGTSTLTVLAYDRSGDLIGGTTNGVTVTNTGTPEPPVGNLVINEVMFHPLNPDAAFVELYNRATNTTFDLSNWQLQGLNYTFPAGSSLAPRSFLVLTPSRIAFAAAYGATVPVFDQFDGSVQLNAATLSLVEPQASPGTNLIVTRIRYESNAPWPAATNGSSLQLIDPAQDNWRVGNWAVSTVPGLGATPAATNSVTVALSPFPPLWINELQADNLTGITNRAGQRTAWLELYNPGSNLVSLAGLCLANNYTNLTQWAFPTNATINSNQFLVVFADGLTNLSTTNELHTSFVLPSGAGALALSRLTTNAQVQVLDYANYTNLSPNYSYGSFPNAQSFDRQNFYHATPGAANDGTSLPPPSFIPYAEAGSVYSQAFDALPNPGATSVNSGNPVTISGTTYSLANPFDFAFPVFASGSIGGLGSSSLVGWYGLADPGASVGTRFGATDGDQTTGGIISFGLPNSSNRAVGLLATSTTGYTAFGAKFINQTADILRYISVEFTGEVWRQSNLPKTLTCYYFIEPTATAPFSTAVTAYLPALNVNFPIVSADTGGVAVDGTAAINQTNLSVLNQAIPNWPPGAALWLVWEMTDPAGKSQGLGIDNLSFTASNQPLTAPVLLSIQQFATNLVFNWSTLVGQKYQVEFNNDLSTTNWVPLGVPVTGNGNPLSATNNPASPRLFYRVRILSP